MLEIDEFLRSFFGTLPGAPSHIHIADDGPHPLYDDTEQRWSAELDRAIERRWLNLDALLTSSEQDRTQRIAAADEARHRGRAEIALRAEREQRKVDAWRSTPSVVDEHYGVTLDRVPRDLYGAICRNSSQLAAWKAWMAIDTLDDFAEPLTCEFLESHSHLVVDTRHFDATFRTVLLESLGGADMRLDGVAIRGENSAALRWLAAQGYDPVRCVFIDPPYNTGSKAWSYDDRFARESWRVMMRDRLVEARGLMADDSAIFVSLDDHEHVALRGLMDEIFDAENFLATIVWEKVHTRKNSARHFSVSHDYIPAYSKDAASWTRHLLPRDETTAYANPDDDPRGPWKLDPIYANKPYAADYTIRKPNGVVLERPFGRYWRFSRETFEQKAADGEVVWGDGEAWPMTKRYLAEVQAGLVPTTLFTREFAGDNAQANAELAAMFGRGRAVSYPKPSLLVRRLLQVATSADAGDMVLDFFAGSGTTVQAVIDQNREDGGDRRWIVVEKDDVFDSVLLPRIIKSVYSAKWKSGRPTGGQSVGQTFKVVYLRPFDETEV